MIQSLTLRSKKNGREKREQRLRKKSGIRENELVPQGELGLYLGGDVDDIIDILIFLYQSHL